MKNKSHQCRLALGIFFLACFGLFFSIPQVSAQEITTIVQDTGISTTDVSPSIVKLTGNVVSGLLFNVLEAMSGLQMTVSSNGKTYSLVSNADGGLYGFASKILTALTDVPISGAYYLADSAENMGLGIATTAYAQGYGFSALGGLLSAWKSFRNIAYVFMTVIILIVGIMIIFQQKLDGTLVVTVQKAIPKIILALILITFSYAIVGFLIDLMYLVMFMFNSIAMGFGAEDTSGWINWGFGRMALKVIGTLTGEGFLGIAYDNFGELITNFIGNLNFENAGNTAFSLFKIFAWGLDIVMATIFSLVARFIGGIILAIILFCIALSVCWKLLKILAKAYFSIIFNLIFAPIILLSSALPGSKAHVKWFKRILGNLSVFPTLFISMVLIKYISEVVSGETLLTKASSLSVMAAEGTALSMPFFVAPDTSSLMGAIIVIAGFITLPEILEKVSSSLGADKTWFGGLAGSAWGVFAGNGITKKIAGGASNFAKNKLPELGAGAGLDLLTRKKIRPVTEDTTGAKKDASGRWYIDGKNKGEKVYDELRRSKMGSKIIEKMADKQMVGSKDADSREINQAGRRGFRNVKAGGGIPQYFIKKQEEKENLWAQWKDELSENIATYTMLNNRPGIENDPVNFGKLNDAKTKIGRYGYSTDGNLPGEITIFTVDKDGKLQVGHKANLLATADQAFNRWLVDRGKQ